MTRPFESVMPFPEEGEKTATEPLDPLADVMENWTRELAMGCPLLRVTVAVAFDGEANVNVFRLAPEAGSVNEIEIDAA